MPQDEEHSFKQWWDAVALDEAVSVKVPHTEHSLRRYDMSTSLPLTKWPPNFRMILIYFFSTGDVPSLTTMPELFMHVCTFHFLFRIFIL